MSPSRHDELLDDVVDYIQAHGLAGLSLRPLAEAIGTSARMLVYHFSSKEQLIADALDAVRQRQQAQVEQWVAASEGWPFTDLMTRFWAASTSAEFSAYGRLFFEAYGIALVDRHQLPGFLDGAVHGWLELLRTALIDAGIVAAEADWIATAALAAHRGLLLDLFATGDVARVNKAHQRILTLLEADVSERIAARAGVT